MKAFVVYSTYEISEDKTEVQLFGRLENGKSFVAVIPFTPYFFIEEASLKKSKSLLKKFKTEKTSMTNFKGKNVIRISSPSQQNLVKLTTALHKKKINTYEADIKPDTRFLIDNDILGVIEIPDSEHYETSDSQKVDRIYENPKIEPLPESQKNKFKPKLKIISLDIESNKKTDDLFCIGLYGENYKRNLLISKSREKLPNTILCRDEQELLEKFKLELERIDPDIITGWHVIDFDLLILKKRFEKNKIPFDIGRTNEQAKIKIQSGFFRSSSADVPGRQVLDALNLIRDPFIKEAPSIKKAKFDSYSLEDVSQEILNEGKLLKGKSRHDEIEELFKKNQKKLVEYNLQDCKLAYDILDKTKTIDLAIERSTLTGIRLNRITASITSFDSLYIREARKKGLVSPTTQYSERGKRITGGYVMESKPGIYHNVLVLDFKSLYPSVIKTFNIDPASYLEKKQKNSVMSPNKAYFKNQEGVLPGIIEKLHQAREKAKREKRELSSYAIKIIMNSFFGVLASPNCRYFNLKMANAITHFGQFIIKLTAREIEKLGYKVIYSDTDSVFVETGLSKQNALELGEKIQTHINNFYDSYVKREYRRKSYLELEFEKLYFAFMMPPIRGSEGQKGSKKRYAGLLEKSGKEQIQVVGLEAIRGDWTEAAQEFQIKLLDKIFHRQEFIRFIREYVKNIREGKLDEKLIYKKSITKPLDAYVKTTPPHVKAARKLDKLESNIIRYYQTEKGPEPIQKLKHKIDYDHYIKKQIAPIANTLLFFFDKDFDEIISTSKQMKLF